MADDESDWPESFMRSLERFCEGLLAMSPDESLEFLRYLLFFEKNIVGRAMTPEERLELQQRWPESAKERAAFNELSMHPIERKLRLVAFKKKLKARQGSIPPDFEALYRKKADMDRRLLEDPRVDPEH